MTDNANVDLLSERALYAVDHAEEEARLLRSAAVGTEHLLLGLVREGDGISFDDIRSSSVRVLSRAVSSHQPPPRSDLATSPPSPSPLTDSAHPGRAEPTGIAAPFRAASASRIVCAGHIFGSAATRTAKQSGPAY